MKTEDNSAMRERFSVARQMDSLWAMVLIWATLTALRNMKRLMTQMQVNLINKYC